MVNVRRAEEQLVLHEGLRLAAYLDTVDKWTIGVGFNITDRGVPTLEKLIGRSLSPRMQDLRISRPEAMQALHADIIRLDAGIPYYFPEYVTFDEVRRRVVLDLVFNMGFKTLGFKNTIGFMKKRDWSNASINLWKSRWADQVGDGPGKHWDRADRLTKMLLSGVDYVV